MTTGHPALVRGGHLEQWRPLPPPPQLAQQSPDLRGAKPCGRQRMNHSSWFRPFSPGGRGAQRKCILARQGTSRQPARGCQPWLMGRMMPPSTSLTLGAGRGQQERAARRALLSLQDRAAIGWETRHQWSTYKAQESSILLTLGN